MTKKKNIYIWFWCVQKMQMKYDDVRIRVFRESLSIQFQLRVWMLCACVCMCHFALPSTYHRNRVKLANYRPPNAFSLLFRCTQCESVSLLFHANNDDHKYINDSFSISSFKTDFHNWYFEVPRTQADFLWNLSNYDTILFVCFNVIMSFSQTSLWTTRAWFLF